MIGINYIKAYIKNSQDNHYLLYNCQDIYLVFFHKKPYKYNPYFKGVKILYMEYDLEVSKEQCYNRKWKYISDYD